MAETITYTVDKQIATIAFDRPQAMNSFNFQMAKELEEITEMVYADRNIRAVLLKGNGHLFMAGGDLQLFHERLDKMPEGVMKIVRTLNASIENLMNMPKPVLASVHGSVAGVGVSFMMACDLVIASQETKFNMAYNGIGISPDGGATFNLPRHVGVKKAMELILLSPMFDANEALDFGLINWVVPKENLSTQTEKILHQLANGPTQSYASAKKLINQSWQHSLSTQLEAEGRAFEACSTTTDFGQGVSAFLKKEKPTFAGH